MKTAAPYKEIACQQVQMHDASVFSIQWTVMPARHAATLTPNFILERYLCHLRRSTIFLVRPVRTEQGLDFRLLSTKVSLLSFRGPLFSAGGAVRSATLQISGGLLVHPDCRNRGSLSFITEAGAEGVKVTLQLSDYSPLLLGSPTPSKARTWLYRQTQARIHKSVTVRFLARLYREMEGQGACHRVVRVNVRSGEDI